MTTLLYDKFEMPEKIRAEAISNSRFSVRFIAEPLEKGFGHTLGNALRRILLTGIEAPAIVSFFMEGVAHEYMTKEGVKEDVTNIILNLKGALIRSLPIQGEQSSRDKKVFVANLIVTEEDLAEDGERSVTLGDLINEADVEVINPELEIFTVTKPMECRVQIKVAIGRGYIPSERQDVQNKIINEIVMDSIFSPVKLVNYFVEETRVGQDTDFDRLILEVLTDGRITPQEAVSFASKILVKQLSIFEELDERDIAFEEVSTSASESEDELLKKLVLGIDEIELSVRSTNCLSNANIETIGELVIMSEPRLLQFRNFGKKSLCEIKNKLREMKLDLGMDLANFGVTFENVKDKMKVLSETFKSKNTKV